MSSPLDQLTEGDLAFAIRLPYRVGLWVSRSDSRGGSEADAQEMAALTAVMIAYAEDFCKSEFVQRVMEQALAQRAHWPEWSANIQSVPDECRRIAEMLGGYLPDSELLSFRRNLMEIGLSVAAAHREETAEPAGIARWMRGLASGLHSLVSFFNPPPKGMVVSRANISSVEMRALKTLAQVLGFSSRDWL